MTTIITEGDNQDKILVQRNTDSFSIDAGKSMETIQDTDYILVQRGEESYRVSGAIAKDDLGTKGEIEEPVAVISPEDGAGLSDENVYPAAEGITEVEEVAEAVLAQYLDDWSSKTTLNPIDGYGVVGGTSWVEVKDSMFDNRLLINVSPTSGTEGTVTFSGLPDGDKYEVYVFRSGTKNSPGITINGKTLSELGVTEVDSGDIGWVDAQGVLTEVFLKHVGGGYQYGIGGIKVDGRILLQQSLVDAGAISEVTETVEEYSTRLTYTTDRSLNLLTAGQSMTQQPAYTPVTDTITEIVNTDIVFTFDAAFVEKPGFGTLVSLDVPNFNFDANNYNYTNLGTGIVGNVSTGTPFAYAGDNVKTFQYGSAGEDIAQKRHQLILDNGTVLEADSATQGSTSEYYYFSFVIPPGRSCSQIRCVTDGYSARAIIYGVMVNDTALGTSYSVKELSFATPKDIVNFRPGDLVQNYSKGQIAWSEGLDTQPDWNNYPSLLTHNVVGSKVYIDSVSDNIDPSTIIGIWASDNGTTFISRVLSFTVSELPKEVNVANYYLRFSVVGGSDSQDYSLTVGNSEEVVSVVSTDAAASKMVVDGGDWSDGSGVPDGQNRDDVWSNYGDVSNWINAFDGDLTSGTHATVSDRGAAYWNIGSSNAIPGTLELYFANGGFSATNWLEINGVPTSLDVTGPNQGKWLEIAGVTELYSINLLNPSDDVWGSISGIRVGGKVLVDGTGQTKVTGPVCQGTGEYVSYTANTFELTNVGDRWCIDDQNVGLAAVSDTEYTILAPDPNEIVFQSANGEPLTTTFSAENCVLREITWTLGASETGEAGTYVETEYKQSVAVPINIEVPPWAGPPDGLANDTYYSLKVKYEADSRAETVESNTIYFKTRSGDEPQSVQMSGLRFDPNRNTYLSNSSISFGTDWTFSAWIKYTNKPGNPSITWLFSDSSSGSPDASNEGLRIMPSDSKLYYYNNTGQLLLSNTPIEQNVWTHIVVSLSGSRMLAHINGGEDVNTIGQVVSLDGIAIGRWDDDNILNGYLSDVYFVEDQVLDASAFGKDYDGLWGPLPNETVLNNITRILSPYDQRPLMDEKWSDLVTGGGSYQLAFDGDLNTGASLGGNAATLVFNPPIKGTSVTAWIAGGIQVIINPGDNSVPSEIQDSFDYTPTTATASSEIDISEIRITAGGSWAQLAIDGRVLIDGPADNSQNWSYYFTGDTITDGELAFDGNDVSTYATIKNAKWEPDTPIAFTQKVEAFFYRAANAVSYKLLGGVETVSSNDGAPAAAWTDVVTGSGTLEYITWSDTKLYAIRIDGKLYVNSGAQWNTSQVWSNDVVGAQTNDARFTANKMFDGEFSGTNANGLLVSDTGTQAIWTTNAFPDAKKVKIYYYSLSADADGLQVNGTNIPIEDNVNTSVVVDVDGVGLTSVSSNCASGAWASTYVCIKGIEVDGVLLVDPGSLGANGFYLPFDPTQEGVKYQQSFTSSTNNLVEEAPNALFNGDSSVGILFNSVGSTDNCVITLATPIVTSGEITVYYQGQGSGRTIQFNNDAAQAFIVGTGGSTRESVLTAPEEINTITIQDASGSGASARVTQLEVDGKALVDHNNIGVDASGNGNNFHDENFAVGNTSQVWSTSLSKTSEADHSVIGAEQQAFDGNIDTSFEILVPTTTASAKAELAVTIPDVQTLEFFGGTLDTGICFNCS